MSTAIQQFSQKYFKLPDCWRSLLVLGGFLIVDKYIIEKQVENFIFGADGHGGEILIIKSRMDHHEQEFREERKKFYWHQRSGRFYMPYGFTLNTKLDYETLSYGYSHFDTYSDPKKIPSGHHSETDTFSTVSHENFHKE